MISVIVPVYNVEPYLGQCINSILTQTYRDVEILLIDDGSPDRCGKICEEYAHIDNRIRVFHTENRGLSAARNLGIREAKGDYIGFVDADDWIEPEMYEVLYDNLKKTGTDISVGGMWYEYVGCSIAKTDIPNIVYTNTEMIRALIRIKSFNYIWNKLYKKECWRDIQFPNGHTFEDVATTYKLLQKSHSVSCTTRLLYHYRMREGSVINCCSMNNLMDNWNTRYTRYVQLRTMPEINNDLECINKLEEDLAIAAAKAWRWMYGIPKKERDYEFLHMVSEFARNHFPVFGYKDLGYFFQMNIFFTRHVNDLVFAFLYAMNKCYYCFRNKKKFKAVG